MTVTIDRVVASWGAAALLVMRAASAADATIHEIYQAATTGHLDRAQQMIEQVLRDHPESSKAHFVQAELFSREGKFGAARTELERAEQLDPGLTKESPSAVRALKDAIGERGAVVSPPASARKAAPAGDTLTTRVPLADAHGTLTASVLINNAIKLDFTVDSGASDVTIPSDVYSTLVRAHTIADSDVTGSAVFVDAEGERHASHTFLIRSLKVGEVEVLNVAASVTPAKGPLLLGQSFLKRFKHWSIDNTSHDLILER